MRPAVRTWLRRGCFAAILLALAFTPGPASAARPCTDRACQAAGQPRWTQLLPGPWVAEPGLGGTTPAQGEAYAAMGRQLAVIGFGSTVQAYRASTGAPLWVSSLAGFGAGAQIVSVRTWPRVITAGVTVPGRPPGTASTRREVVLSAASGRLIRSFPAAPFGGAVSAAAGRTVIVGNTAVTCFSNRTGRVLWSRPTGSAAQAWKTDGNDLYLTVAAGGYLSGAPVRALRKINLRTGAQRLIRPLGPSFQGTLSRAFDGVVVFTGPRGTIAYSGSTGAWLWRRAGALPEVADPVDGLLYLSEDSALAGVDPWTGRTEAHVSGGSAPGPAAFYAVRGGTVLGLDQGAAGDAWGYSESAGRVLWTNPAVPWPHFFVDLSGIGGSTSPWSTAVLLAVCGQTGTAVPGGAGQVCVKPELTALNW
ncbi:MAG: PQQ-binding-like beta-propeller repeat protein [Streptosporangiaceae bacterium]